MPAHAACRAVSMMPRTLGSILRPLASRTEHDREVMAQAVHDFRSVVDYLEYTGVDRIALTGISLGGFTSVLASVDDRPGRAASSAVGRALLTALHNRPRAGAWKPPPFAYLWLS